MPSGGSVAYLRLGHRARVGLVASTVACALETSPVTLQTWRGVPSHFNLETTFDGLVARNVGRRLVLVAIIMVLSIASFRANSEVPISLRLAIRIGFLALVGAVVVGVLMIAKGMTLVFE